MNDNELVIVDVNGGFTNIWTFCDADNALQALERAKASAAESIATYNHHIVNYPNNADYWKFCRSEYENARYEIMTLDQFLQCQRYVMLDRPVKEITAEIFDEMLNVLPPLRWCTIRGIEMFCMSEMYTGTYTDQYARVGEKYYTALVDIYDQSTWIHNRI